MSKESLQKVIDSGAADEPLNDFFNEVSDGYREVDEPLETTHGQFANAHLLGEITFSPIDKLAIVTADVTTGLTERSGKKAQYEFARKLLRDWQTYDGGIFIFKGDKKQFRFSLVYTQYQGTKRDFSNFRRFTYYVDHEQTNKTFKERVGLGGYSNLDKIKEAFSVEKVNKEFYKQIAQYFYRLTGKDGKPRELSLPDNGSANARFLEEFAVRLIGRIIFCWFLKHKKSAAGIPLIPETVLSSTAITEEYYHTILERLFFEVMNTPSPDRKPELTSFISEHEQIPFLNGGLFEPHENDYYKDGMNRSLIIPDSWFKDFFNLLGQYNFTIDENTAVDAEVSVDPEMMGRIFENLLAEVNPETGETARKSTGSYYTPRVIVDYMVEQSLKQYLLTKTDIGEKKATDLLSYEEELKNWTDCDKEVVVKALREIKILDPACGSGAFPLGILHRMIIALEKVDPELKIWRKAFLDGLDSFVKQTVEKNISKSNWAYIRKLMIIRDSIYGVDIQPIAVEISKLRCFLSLVVDEIVVDNETHRGIEPLPNLEFKFVAANSLIGLPPLINRQTGLRPMETEIKDEDPVVLLKNIRDAYLRSYGDEKQKLERDFMAMRTKLIEQNIKWGGKDTVAIQIASWNPFSYEASGWFEPEWMFGSTNGFDIVIANPPYGADIPQTNLNSIKMAIGDCGNNNSAALFIMYAKEKLLSKLGVLTYIVPKSFLYAEIWSKLACKLNEGLTSLLDVEKAFEDVKLEQIVFCYRSRFNNGGYFANKFIDGEIGYGVMIPKEVVRHYDAMICGVTEDELKIVSHLDDIIFMRDISKTRRGAPIQRHLTQSGKIPVIGGKNISSYGISGVKGYVSPTIIENASKKIDFLRQQKIMSQRLVAHIHNPFPHLKIMATYDVKGDWISVDTVENTVLTTKDYDYGYILALLNSTFISWYTYKFIFCSAIRTMDLDDYYMGKIPVKIISKQEQGNITSLAQQILTLTNDYDYATNQEKQSLAQELRNHIDRLVYDLYGLTANEVAVVEGQNEGKLVGARNFCWGTK
jgi:hypothetical protein